MDRDAAARILAAASGRTVVVVGDLMLDQFIWGTVERISPEAPVPVVKVSRESHHLGGAGNVAANLAALGARPVPVGVVGCDRDAEALRAALARLGVPADGVVEVAGRATTVKTRIVAHHQQVVRFDREQDEPLDDRASAALAEKAVSLCATAHALVVSDYEKGCVTPAVLSRLLPAVHRRGLPVVVDPKPGHWRAYTPITAITPNQAEAVRMAGLRARTDEDVLAAARAIRKALSCRAVLLTRGEKGMTLLEDGADPLHIPAAARQVFDVTGAGDTVAAVLALGLASGASLAEAATLANAAAGVVVTKLGTATATPEELLASS